MFNVRIQTLLLAKRYNSPLTVQNAVAVQDKSSPARFVMPAKWQISLCLPDEDFSQVRISIDKGKPFRRFLNLFPRRGPKVYTFVRIPRCKGIAFTQSQSIDLFSALLKGFDSIDAGVLQEIRSGGANP
jgi:hypothetical protein